MSARPVIALLTDFGLRDHYVGSMKGVIAGICPEAHLIDITHEVPAQDVQTAAFELAAAWSSFPPSTIFLVVVDPGVGTSRVAMACRLAQARLVGPDNGVFDLVLRRQQLEEARQLNNPRFQRPTVSTTFEGRDRFAPAAAWLAAGVPFDEMGPVVEPSVRLAWPVPRTLGDRGNPIVGEVVHVDRFGNLITNIHRTLFPADGPLIEAWIHDRGPIPLVHTYGQAPAGTLVALFGSTDLIEVAVVSGHAASTIGAGRGAEVRVVPRA